MEHEVDSDINFVDSVGTIPKGLVKGLGELEIGKQAETI